MGWALGQLIHQRYNLQRCLRDRSGHQVWLALDSQSHDTVIIKRLTFEGKLQWDDVKLFEREVQTLKHISHPQIPKVRDSFSIETPVFQLCFVEDYIVAPSLQTFLNREKYFSQPQIWLIAAQILHILIYLHGQTPPILHRDIKPSNLLITAEKVVYLIDFGAVQIHPRLTGIIDPPTVVGTYGYTPIEQFAGEPTPASDLFALGATLIHLLSRKPPIVSGTQTLAIQIPPELPLHSQRLQWLATMTAPQARDRFPSAAQALQALQSANTAHADFLSHSQPSDARSRISIEIENDALILEIEPRWNRNTLAPSDLLLILGLSYLPLLLGSFVGLFGFSVLGTPLAGGGLGSLLMLGGGFPAFLGSSVLIRNLSQIKLICTAADLKLQRSVVGINVVSNRWSWSEVRDLQSFAHRPDDCSTVLHRISGQAIVLAQHLSCEDAELCLQKVERWKIAKQRTLEPN